MPRNKIVMGVSPYGRTWLLNDAEVNGVGAPARPGAPFESNLEGVASLSDICHLSYYARPTWNDIQKVPYMVQKNVWVSYDNEESVKEKMKYVVENEYAGAYLYELSLDDFRSRCHGGLAAGFQPFDIANFMKKYLQTDFPVKPTSPPTPTPQPEYPGPCDHEVADGYNSPFRIDPKSCERYYYCGSDASYHRVIRHLSCGPGLWWSKTGEKCVYAHYGFCENIPPVMPPPPFWNGTYPFVDAVNNATKPKLEKLDGKLQ
uniref:Chitin-binding type-2 domain-containing protein n=1 Tax=Panagrellus redivivus TaxID=6233 RepID=A0A7E4ZQJ8_PANRE